jgi:hypothetical protein
MSIHIYHPNKNNTGFACSFSLSPKDKCTIFTSIIKQAGWDATKQVGTFKDSKNDPTRNVNVKLEEVEVAAILDCIDRNRAFSTVHDSDKLMKSIKFEPWMNRLSDESIKAGEKPTQKGFSFSVTVTDKQDSTKKNSFYIGLTYAEGRLVREYLMFALQKSFAAEPNSEQL